MATVELLVVPGGVSIGEALRRAGDHQASAVFAAKSEDDGKVLQVTDLLEGLRELGAKAAIAEVRSTTAPLPGRLQRLGQGARSAADGFVLLEDVPAHMARALSASLVLWECTKNPDHIYSSDDYNGGKCRLDGAKLEKL